MAGGRDPEEDLKTAGIPPASRFEKITYNRTSNAVVAHFRRGRAGSLYYRQRGRARYRKVAQLGERVRYDYMVSASEAPVVFVNAMEFRTESEASDWVGVARLDMRTRKITLVFCEEDIKLSPPYSRGWVRELLESWPDGRGVVSIMSFERPPTAAEKKRWLSQGLPGELVSAGEHWICDLDLEQKTYERLTLLKAIFF